MATVDKKVVVYLQQVKNILRSNSDWLTGYSTTDLATQFVMALAEQQCRKGDAKSNQYLLSTLIQFRADVEKALCKKFKTDADGLRYDAKTPDYVKYDLGVMDLLIGCLMQSLGRINIVYRNVNDLFEAS